MAVPIVYALGSCPACEKLRAEWGAQGIEYEERRVDLDQATLDEALTYGSVVPLIVHPDGRVEEGFPGAIG